MNRSVICSVLFVCALLAALAASAPAAYAAGMPVTGTITPSSGSLVTGVKQSFVATFSDGDGHADIADCRVLLNTALQGANGIFLRLDRANNRLWLRSDNNAAWLGGHAPGSGNVIENGLCTIHCDRTTFSGNGSTLTLNISLTLKPLVAGKTLTEWLYAGDAAGNGDGWNEAGAIAVVSAAPTNTSVSPSSGLVPAGAQTFTTVQRDASGYADLQCSYLLINNAVSGIGAVYAWYDRTANKLYLRDDANAAWLGGYAPGSANTIENSRAKLLCSGTTVTGSGQDLTITWRLETKPTMQARRCGIWLYAVDKGGANTGFEKMGEVTFVQPPANASLAPSASNSLSAGTKTVLTAAYSDPDGHADIRNTYLVLNTALSSFRGISLWYDAAANKLYLRNDVNTVWTGGHAPGTAGAVLENSYCRVDCAASAVVRDGNNLRVNWSIEPKSPMVGKALKAWMYVDDAAGATDGWDEMASYIIGAPGLNVSVSPINTSLSSEITTTLTTRCLAPNGQSATSTYLLLNSSLSAGGAVYLYYDGPGNKLWLRNDAGSAWLGGHAPGSANTISNNLVTVNCAASTAAMVADQLEVRWSVQFRQTAGGRSFNVWMYTLDNKGRTDGWDAMGSLGVVLPVAAEMIYIPPGSFLMGNNGSEPDSWADELPQHEVFLSGYWIGKYEVTRGEFREFMEAGGYSNPAYWSSAGWSWKVAEGRTEPSHWAADQDWASGSGIDPQPFTQTEAHPVVGVSYYEAEAYCAWADGHLPTEAQWEKAARWTGSYPNVYPWGNEWDAEKCNTWDDHNLAAGGYQKWQTAPVGSYPSGASPYGLQDMAGNVFEWCRDCYGEDYYSLSPATDPQGPSSGSHRVVRGGGWYDYGTRSACRNSATRGQYWLDGGFRLARDVAAVATPTFAPDGGTYANPVAVTVSCATSGATIHYTTNGIDPTESDDVVASGGQVTVSQSATLKARAFLAGWTPSSVKAAGYTVQVQVATPQFSPAGGTFTGSVAVTVTCATSGATIHYTTNGADPTESDDVVASGGQVTVSQSATLKARAFLAGWTPSSVKAAGYTVQVQVATPQFSPAGGTFTGSVVVTVTCATSGATIHYTTNGADPTQSDPTVASGGTVKVDHSLTLKARAFMAGWTPSAVKTSSYTINSVCEMIYIPAGWFLLGNNGSEGYSYSDELPQHAVYLSGYSIGKYEVTRGEYRQFMNAGGYSNPAYWSSAGWSWKVVLGRTEPSYWAAVQDWALEFFGVSQPFLQTDSHPVVGVNYYEAEAFCNWAGGHLPTEAQWEKAARWTGSYPNVWPWGNVWDAEKCNTWHDHNSAGGGYIRCQTAPVGSYPSGASPYGLQDMAGNASEWVADWYSSSYYSVSPSTDPQGPSSGIYRLLRGGGWGLNDNFSRCTFRINTGLPNYDQGDGGFRLAR